MKKQYLVFILAVLSVLIFSACATAPTGPRQTTRQEQLSETGLFGRHNIDGVTTENGFAGKVSGGFWLFAASLNGTITSTTEYTIQWQPVPGEFIYTTLPRSVFRVKIEEIAEPQMEIVFKEKWLTNTPSWLDDDPDGNDIDIYFDEYKNLNYTEGAKLNLNNFISPSNIDIVYIYISKNDLTPPTNQIP